MGGSMGSVVGEKFSAAAGYSRSNRMPLICFSASGGARMQEALVFADADGQDQRALAELAERDSVRFRADGSDDGRRVGEPGDARRHQHRASRTR